MIESHAELHRENDCYECTNHNAETGCIHIEWVTMLWCALDHYGGHLLPPTI